MDEDFGGAFKDLERTRVENPINQLIMGEDIVLFKTHLNPEQRSRYELNKFLESFAPIRDPIERNEQIRLDVLKKVADLPEISILNPAAFGVAIVFILLYGNDVAGNISVLDRPEWKDKAYTKADVFRYIRYLASRKIIEQINYTTF